MAAFRSFEEIDAWICGRELVKMVYALAAVGLFSKDWGFRDQIQRAAVSICSNIAEGFGRRGNREFVDFLWIAKGSCAEVPSQMYHAKDLGYVSEEDFQSVYQRTAKISAELYGLIKYLNTHLKQNKI